MARTLLALAIPVATLAACGPPEAVGPPADKAPPIQIVTTAPQPVASAVPPTGSCTTLGMTNVVGQPFTTAVAEQARAATKAMTLSVLRPGEMAGTPPSGDRLTLEVNGNDTIIDARCE